MAVYCLAVDLRDKGLSLLDPQDEVDMTADQSDKEQVDLERKKKIIVTVSLSLVVGIGNYSIYFRYHNLFRLQ